MIKNHEKLYIKFLAPATSRIISICSPNFQRFLAKLFTWFCQQTLKSAIFSVALLWAFSFSPLLTTKLPLLPWATLFILSSFFSISPHQYFLVFSGDRAVFGIEASALTVFIYILASHSLISEKLLNFEHEHAVMNFRNAFVGIFFCRAC